MALAILDGTQTATTLSTILSSGQHITAHTVVSLGTQAITDMRSAVSGSVVSISNFPATQPISGTVTVGVLPALTNNTDFVGVGENIAQGINNYGTIPVDFNEQNLQQGLNGLLVNATCVTSTNRIGVVTASLSAGTAQIGSVTVGNSVTIGSLPAISGTVTAMAGTNFSQEIYTGILTYAGNEGGDGAVPFYVNVGSLYGALPAGTNQIGSVTANSSNGSLTTRFGSVTTANTAFATSAVTNANRKYLLIQNVTTASNVITVGIGFTPTTTQGIQLSSGAGLTFEGSYIPTGAVNLLSSVTASCFTILEA